MVLAVPGLLAQSYQPRQSRVALDVWLIGRLQQNEAPRATENGSQADRSTKMTVPPTCSFHAKVLRKAPLGENHKKGDLWA